MELDPATQRKNVIFGLALFALFLLLAAGTVLIAIIWVAVD